MRLWSSRDAAQALGISVQRVRALSGAGRLSARKVGSRWLVEPVSAVREPRAGRPLSSACAWAILAELSGARPDWVHPSALSRLRRRMRDQEWVLRSLRHSEARAEVVHWRALPADLPRILTTGVFVRTGLSAVSEEIDIVSSGDGVDAYVAQSTLSLIKRRFQPATNSDEPNLTLRLPTQPWVLSLTLAPPAVVAADLLLSPDPRVARAGREAVRKLFHD